MEEIIPIEKPKKRKLGRAMGAAELKKKKFKTHPFDGHWKDSIGVPEVNMKICIWGESGNGKSDFMVQLAKYCGQFGKVLIDSIEEGHSLTMQIAFDRHKLEEVNKQVLLLHREPVDDLTERLARRNSPEFIVLDSIQHSRIKKDEYRALVNRFRKKAFIFISHASGTQPKGDVADFIRYDADVKIRVQGYVAFIESTRFGGGRPFVIWQDGAEEYWGASLAAILKGKKKTKEKTFSKTKKNKQNEINAPAV